MPHYLAIRCGRYCVSLIQIVFAAPAFDGAALTWCSRKVNDARIACTDEVGQFHSRGEAPHERTSCLVKSTASGYARIDTACTSPCTKRTHLGPCNHRIGDHRASLGPRALVLSCVRHALRPRLLVGRQSRELASARLRSHWRGWIIGNGRAAVRTRLRLDDDCMQPRIVVQSRQRRHCSMRSMRRLRSGLGSLSRNPPGPDLRWG